MRIAGQQQTWSRREQAVFGGGLVVYGIALAVGRASVDGGDPDWRRWVVVGVAIAAALVSLSAAFSAARRTKEVDRLVVSESTSLAFVATMLASVTYGLLESIVELPRLSAWATWMFGMGAWLVVSFVVRRRRL